MLKRSFLVMLLFGASLLSANPLADEIDSLREELQAIKEHLSKNRKVVCIAHCAAYGGSFDFNFDLRVGTGKTRKEAYAALKTADDNCKKYGFSRGIGHSNGGASKFSSMRRRNSMQATCFAAVDVMPLPKDEEEK